MNMGQKMFLLGRLRLLGCYIEVNPRKELRSVYFHASNLREAFSNTLCYRDQHTEDVLENL